MATDGKERGTIYVDAKGRWTVAIELNPNGKARRRKVVRTKTETEAKRTLRYLLNELDKTGDLQTRVLTVERWMDEWFNEIAVKKIRPKTAATYRGLIHREIIPALGKIKLNKLTPADVRRMVDGIVAKGLSPTTAFQTFSILKVALNVAEREGHVSVNVATKVDRPKRATPRTRALTVEEAKKVLRAADGDPLESLWYFVILTAARQGELLGLEVDRVTDVMEVSWQLQRLPWEHGCDGTCGRKRAEHCKMRTLTAPSDWEHRKLTGALYLTRPKTNAGYRVIPLVGPLGETIQRHLATCDYPNPYGLVWRMPNGNPVEPGHQSREWHKLLERAGVPDVRLHDGRHTAVDLLYEAGVPEDLIQEIVGHSTRAMSRAYKSRGNRKRLEVAMLQMSELVSSRDDGHSEIAS